MRGIRCDCRADSVNVITQYMHSAALRIAGSIHQTANDRFTAFDRNRAARRARSAECRRFAFCGGFNFVGGFEYHAPGVVHTQGIGVNFATVTNGSRQHTRSAAFGQQPAEVYHFAIRRFDFKTDIGIVEARDRERMARG